jgi:hypothetical protein
VTLKLIRQFNKASKAVGQPLLASWNQDKLDRPNLKLIDYDGDLHAHCLLHVMC